MEHGVSQDLLEFVSQLTVETFVAFPVEDMDDTELKMTRWQENHCKYMLLICQEVCASCPHQSCPQRPVLSGYGMPGGAARARSPVPPCAPAVAEFGSHRRGDACEWVEGGRSHKPTDSFWLGESDACPC